MRFFVTMDSSLTAINSQLSHATKIRCRVFSSFAVGVIGLAAVAAAAQDTQYPPRGQQIPVPECMNLRNTMDTTIPPTCPPLTHERWLRDLEHWRAERHIRTTFDPTRYEM